MAKPEISYNSLTNEGNPFVEQRLRAGNDGTDTENDEAQGTGMMIHVVPETNKNRWNHIENLDSFFARMYQYHQKHGFNVMMLQEIFSLGQFIFVVTFTTFLRHCVNYPVLFKDKIVDPLKTKITLNDVIIPPAECVDKLSGFTWIIILLSIFFWLFRLIKVLYNFIQFWDIKMFFNTALKIDDAELDNLTWHEVQRKIREVQSEQQMCIHKEQLTELDIYHRILRFKNYMVAMMNKNLIPGKVTIPIIGEFVCLSRSLRFNIELILFRGPFSPFENNWHLREEFKRSNRRIDLSNQLSRHIMWVALANLLLSPLIFLWQLMYFFFNYGELIKREPGTLSMRCWSQYGRLYLRHFNELDHELDARLTRAYRPAGKYMNSFSSPLMAVIARNLVFVCGGMLTVMILLTIYDEDVVQVEHVFTIMSILTAVVVIARAFIPDENLIWCPEQLMTAVLAHVHYLPVSWRGLAHTSRVRDQFGQLFQLRAIHIFIELISPVCVPFLLMWSFRPRSLDLVDFFRNFTVSVVGVGDVCSFAQMDVRKHGNPDWQLTHSQDDNNDDDDDDHHDGDNNDNKNDNKDKKHNIKKSPIICDTNQYTQGENGKTELSLVHFTLTNPQWKMPSEAKNFVQGIKRHALQDLNRTTVRGTFAGGAGCTAMGQSLMSVGSMGEEYSSIVQSILQTHNITSSQMGFSIFNQQQYSQHQQQPQHIISPTNYPTHQTTTTNSKHSFDFDRMLQQNLTDASTAPLRSTLHNINEDEDDYGININMEQQQSRMEEGGVNRSFNNTSGIQRSMSQSMRGGISKREGPIEGSRDGLLLSVTGALSCNEPIPLEITATDMCLSTLYLHELHHRQIRRRGIRFEQSQHHLWQRPHQQQPDTSSRSYNVGPSTSQQHQSQPQQTQQQQSVAEKTPLLGGKS